MSHEQPLAAINQFIAKLNDWYGGLNDQQKALVTAHMLQHNVEQRSADRTVRTRRLRRHWGPRRLTAARDRKETK